MSTSYTPILFLGVTLKDLNGSLAVEEREVKIHDKYTGKRCGTEVVQEYVMKIGKQKFNLGKDRWNTYCKSLADLLKSCSIGSIKLDTWYFGLNMSELIELGYTNYGSINIYEGIDLTHIKPVVDEVQKALMRAFKLPESKITVKLYALVDIG